MEHEIIAAFSFLAAAIVYRRGLYWVASSHNGRRVRSLMAVAGALLVLALPTEIVRHTHAAEWNFQIAQQHSAAIV
ncbi:MAG: hypothetical protein B7Z71_00510 [Acidocella sp. 21-58-7]|nr:MAG: hypothetical protein B7Z71_00510 [Acidocella sp. 21-58-7]